MTINDMIIGVQYKVIKQSNDETFLLNEIIERNDTNDILGYDGAGWIDAKDVDKALEGCELEACKDYAIRRIDKLTKEIEQLKKDYEL